MRRREFITLLGGAAAAPSLLWPRAAHAQNAMPVVGWLSGRTAETDALVLPAVRRALSQHGFVEGRNLTVEYRYAAGQFDRLPALADELFKRRVAAIMQVASDSGGGFRSVIAAAGSTPIIFNSGNDPVTMGYVASLSRPGGNATGVSSYLSQLGQKRLGLLRELLPRAATFAVLTNPAAVSAELKEVQEAAAQLGLELKVLRAGTDSDLATALASLPQLGVDALLVTISPYFFMRANEIIAGAARHGVPALYGRREFVTGGGLMSYGSNPDENYRILGDYAGRILKGAKAGDLPVQLPTQFELVLNLGTARAMGITLPATLLARADEVIE